jgi:hypothetical protein
MSQPDQIELTSHAVERFRERVRPGLDLTAAEDQLATLLEAFGRWSIRPSSLQRSTPRRPGWR